MQNLSKYLVSEIKDFLFTELDSSFLAANDLGCLEGVEIPIKQDDLQAFSKNGLSTTAIADSMALVLGADTEFKYAASYVQYLSKLFDEKLVFVFAGKADKLVEEGKFRKALCYTRAGMLLETNKLQAEFAYANCCRNWYLSLEGSDEIELISVLKDEANAYFAEITNEFPDFAPAWYYLGFAYLNAGSYAKANLAFKHYLNNSKDQPKETIDEVKERIEQLIDPIKIEEGKNALAEGRTEDALKILEPYVSTEYSKWWPLHFYLALAYTELGYIDEAIEGYRKVLELSPSNYDAMVSLADLYEQCGEEEMSQKYSEKAKIVLCNMHDEETSPLN